jgi:hypothetical protein
VGKRCGQVQPPKTVRQNPTGLAEGSMCCPGPGWQAIPYCHQHGCCKATGGDATHLTAKAQAQGISAALHVLLDGRLEHHQAHPVATHTHLVGNHISTSCQAAGQEY